MSTDNMVSCMVMDSHLENEDKLFLPVAVAVILEFT